MINSKAKEKKKQRRFSRSHLLARRVSGGICVPSQGQVPAPLDRIPLQRRTIEIEIYEIVHLESESTLV